MLLAFYDDYWPHGFPLEAISHPSAFLIFFIYLESVLIYTAETSAVQSRSGGYGFLEKLAWVRDWTEFLTTQCGEGGEGDGNERIAGWG